MEKFVCRMLLMHKGAGNAHYNVDLLLPPDGPPLAVLEWRDSPDGTSIPSVALQLEPKHLHQMPPSWAPVTHMYEKTMDSPIPLRRQ